MAAVSCCLLCLQPLNQTNSGIGTHGFCEWVPKLKRIRTRLVCFAPAEFRQTNAKISM